MPWRSFKPQSCSRRSCATSARDPHSQRFWPAAKTSAADQSFPSSALAKRSIGSMPHIQILHTEL
jgi:hypothetical protein